jgi:hypothetical protein
LHFFATSFALRVSHTQALHSQAKTPLDLYLKK